MKVFSACMKIVRYHKMTFLVYLLLFLALCAGMAILQKNPSALDFTEEKPPFAVINRGEQDALTEGMEQFLDRKGKRVSLLDEKRALEDAIFYGEVSAVFLFPENFAEKWGTEEELPVEVIFSQDRTEGMYLEAAAESYWKQVRRNLAVDPGLSREEAADLTLQNLQKEISVEMVSGGGAQEAKLYQAYVRLEGYTLMVLIILLICKVQLAFQNPEIRMRSQVSPVNSFVITGQMVAQGAVMSILSWGILTVMGMVIFREQLGKVPEKTLLLLALAGFCLMLVCIAVAEILAILIKKAEIIDMAANFVTLGICFLSGIFVPLELLGEGVKKAAQVTPTYWYAKAVDDIFGLTSFTGEKLRPVFVSLGILLAFAAALLAVAFLLARYRSRGEESY